MPVSLGACDQAQLETDVRGRIGLGIPQFPHSRLRAGRVIGLASGRVCGKSIVFHLSGFVLNKSRQTSLCVSSHDCADSIVRGFSNWVPKDLHVWARNHMKAALFGDTVFYGRSFFDLLY